MPTAVVAVGRDGTDLGREVEQLGPVVERRLLLVEGLRARVELRLALVELLLLCGELRRRLVVGTRGLRLRDRGIQLRLTGGDLGETVGDLGAGVGDLGATVVELLLLRCALGLGREGVVGAGHSVELPDALEEVADLGLLLGGESPVLRLEHDGGRGAGEVGEVLLQGVVHALRLGVRDAEARGERAAEGRERPAGQPERDDPADDDEPGATTGEPAETVEEIGHETPFAKVRNGASSGRDQSIRQLLYKR